MGPPRRVACRHHPLFVYMRHVKENTGEIAITRNPFFRLEALNNRRKKRMGKTMLPWRLDMVVGPFYRGSKEFRTMWKTKFRRYSQRLAAAVIQASAVPGLRVWASEEAAATVRERLRQEPQLHAKVVISPQTLRKFVTRLH